MSDKKVFSDDTKSRLEDLYAYDCDAIINQHASIELFNQKISYFDIQNSMKRQPFVETCNKSHMLELDDFDFAAMDKVLKNINAIPKGKETAVIEMCMAEKLPNVKFFNAEMLKINNTKKYAAPRFIIDLTNEDIKPNQGVRINTGYMVKIPQIIMGKTLVNNEIKNTTVSPQLNIVVVPQIVSKHEGLIPTIYGRDSDDTGLLTINFTTTSKFNSKTKLQVVLNAYSCLRPITSANIINSENTTVELFKAKDNRSGRWVKNPKIKYFANEFDLKSSPGSVMLKTFDNTKIPITTYANQKIQIKDITTLFTSRKREWLNPNVVTVAGVYNHLEPKYTSAAIIADGSDIRNNTHGIVFIKNKIILFSIDGKFNEDCRIVNGAFSNIKNYADIVKKTRQITASLKGLSVGAITCRKIAKENSKYKFEDLIRVYDYHRSINLKDPKLDEKIMSDEKKLFLERPSTFNLYSCNIYKCLKSLAFNFCAERFTDEQLKSLSLSCNINTPTNSNSNDDSMDTIPIHDTVIKSTMDNTLNPQIATNIDHNTIDQICKKRSITDVDDTHDDDNTDDQHNTDGSIKRIRLDE
ncbi:putative gp22-like protein [Esparto virus]|uniref:Putative gp22-like protein n=1 Tax=Esparto virus TaxID=2072209 RepID=A0A2I7G2V5_9VIRU|nr:putative gp22-like protein [Esparto virus]AUQ43957.1 putative gp22-like protein [Esparto virus]